MVSRIRASSPPDARGWTCASARRATRRRRCSGPWSPTWSWPRSGRVILLAYDWLASRDPSLPDIGVALTAIYVVVVLVVGSVLTYLWVELPTGAAGGEKRRSPWAGLLGFFAAVPIVYLVLVVAMQVVRPALG